MAWVKGQSGCPTGRPRKDSLGKTNKDLRTEELESMLNKLKPGMGKAIKCATQIIDDKESSEAGKLRASALVITTYKELIKELYSERYDEEDGKELAGEDETKPIFSLTMISGEKQD